MNVLRKKSAVAKYSPMREEGKGLEQVKDAISADEKGYTVEDVNEILMEVMGLANPTTGEAPGFIQPPSETAKFPVQFPTVNKATYNPSKPNESLDLSGYNYKDLKGPAFMDYAKLVGELTTLEENADGDFVPINGKLMLNDMYDFQLFKTKPLRKQRYRGVADSPFDLVGLAIVSDTAIHTTRIPVKVALEHNRQIGNAHSIAGHGTYYLLKK